MPTKPPPGSRDNFSSAAPSAILGGANRGEIESRLFRERICLAFDGAAAETAEGRVALDMALRLLVRVWPRMAIVDLSGRYGGLADSLAAAARGINPGIQLGGTYGDITRTLVVGRTPLVSHRPAFYVGSRGWVARFSTNGPVGSGATANPFGAAAAACLGAANVFRTAFADAFTDSAPRHADGAIELSIFDYSHGGAAANPPLGEVNLNETLLLGLGAIGGAASWTLARVPRLSGTLHLIDSELVQVANLRRNVLPTRFDVGKAKVNVAAAALTSTDLTVHAHHQTWGEFLADRRDWTLPRVGVAFGSAGDRVAVQAALPRVILNAWTQNEDLGISRHMDFLRAACLACLYGPKGAGPSQSQVIAEAIGLSDAAPEVQDLLCTQGALNRPFLERIAAAKGVEVRHLLSYEGESLQSLYQRVIQSGLLIEMGATERSAVHVPMAFQSALAGTLLAAEIVVDAAFPRPSLPTTTRMDLRRPLADRLLAPAPRDPHGRCLCGDADYREIYARKYRE